MTDQPDPILEGFDGLDEFDLDDTAFGCTAETTGRCDTDTPPRYIHDCTSDDEHPGVHECACGHTWVDPDDG